MNSLRVNSAYLLKLSLFCTLFVVTYRDDSDVSAFARGGDFSDVIQLPLVSTLKSYSVALLIFPLFSVLLALISGVRARQTIGPLTSTLTFLGVFLIVRLLPESPLISAKMAVTSLVISMLVILSLCSARQHGLRRTAQALLAGAIYFAIVHSLFNAGLALGGFGVHKHRFLGTSLHPNFMGVQMACCAILMLAQIGDTKASKAVQLLGIAGALTALVATGSRTGLLMFCTGFAVFWAIRGIKIWQLGLLLLLTPICGIVLMDHAVSRSTVSQYDRGGVDTRAYAWKIMVRDVERSPLGGNGRYPDASESSYLRGWAAAGITFVVFYILYFVQAFHAGINFMIRRSRDGIGAAYLGVIAALMVGGFFEGYLLDTMSFPVFILFCATLGIDLLKVAPAFEKGKERSKGLITSRSLSKKSASK